MVAHMARLMQSVERVTGAAAPKPRPWTRDEFYRLLDEGYFVGQRVELIEGEIIEAAAQRNLHSLGIGFGEVALLKVFPRRNYWVRVQMSLDLTPWSVPDPDLAVIAGSMRQNATQEPEAGCSGGITAPSPTPLDI